MILPHSAKILKHVEAKKKSGLQGGSHTVPLYTHPCINIHIRAKGLHTHQCIKVIHTSVHKGCTLPCIFAHIQHAQVAQICAYLVHYILKIRSLNDIFKNRWLEPLLEPLTSYWSSEHQNTNITWGQNIDPQPSVQKRPSLNELCNHKLRLQKSSKAEL